MFIMMLLVVMLGPSHTHSVHSEPFIRCKVKEFTFIIPFNSHKY